MCFGDSNTWGLNTAPLTEGKLPERFDENTRWTALLQKKLGAGYHVYECGLNGRTTVFDDDTEGGRRGIDTLPVCFEMCDPLDLVVIMLGTNDARSQFSTDADLITRGMRRLLLLLQDLIRKSFNPACEILVVAPPESITDIEGCPLSYKPEWAAVIAGLPPKYEELCQMMGVHFVSAFGCVKPGSADGLHLGKEGHAALAALLESTIREIL